jgi:hypothetical protein
MLGALILAHHHHRKGISDILRLLFFCFNLISGIALFRKKSNTNGISVLINKGEIIHEDDYSIKQVTSQNHRFR